MLRLEDFRHIVPDDVIASIFARARRLYGKHIVHVNSTYTGGGVAAILESLVPLMNDVGTETGWRVLHGTMDFFEITKEFHNGLQGKSIKLTEKKKKYYTQVNENFGRFTHLDHDCVIVHDPQPMPLIASYQKRQPWVWRCHPDLSDPSPELWEFFKNFLLKYDQVIVSSESYFKKDLPINQRLIFPAINPLTQKNISLSKNTISDELKKAHIPTDKPLLTQVSRLDPWKDPEGVLEVFNLVKEKIDCRLVFCYNIATDDPEAFRIHTQILQKAQKQVDHGDVLFVQGNYDALVNAIQTVSDVIIQKSTKEGFCLAVTEALWKARPVVASNIGGIPAQIQDDQTGYLVDPKDYQGFADRIVHLLTKPKEGKRLGANAREMVRENFLITRLLSDYLTMLDALIGG